MEIRGELLKPVEGWWRLLKTWWTYHSIKSKYKSIIAIRNIDGVCSINVSITSEPLVWCPTYAHTYQCSCEPLMQFSITARLQHLEGPDRRVREPRVLNSIPASYWLSLPSLFSLSLVPRLFLTAFSCSVEEEESLGTTLLPSLSLSLSLVHPLYSLASLLSFYNLGFTSSKSTRSNPWWTWKSSSRYTSTVRYKWASLRSFRRRYSRCLGVEFEWCASACMNWGYVWKCHLVSEVALRTVASLTFKYLIIVQKAQLCILISVLLPHYVDLSSLFFCYSLH